MLESKNIILGVTGSIAAYKSASLIRLLVKEGANVKVVMTDTAKKFITPLTLATLSRNPVLVEFFDPENGNWNSHVSLGLWADLYLIAPATANTIGGMVAGTADNLLLTTYLSARCPVMVAPAMDADMYAHPSTQRNMERLRDMGNIVIAPDAGDLASGLIGKGRMAEPEAILKEVKRFFAAGTGFWKGKKVMVTAGPTYEKIDPVRFIGNYSSGKMGFALAGVFAACGAEVTLISGPVSLELPDTGINRINVESAEEMYSEVMRHYAGQDVLVMSAAVADFSPLRKETSKLKRGKDRLVLELMPTRDIAAEVGRLKKETQLLVGFALETDDELKNAVGKLERKNMDVIVLNSLNDEGAGFMKDTNKVTLIGKSGEREEWPLMSKREVAEKLVIKLEKYLSGK